MAFNISAFKANVFNDISPFHLSDFEVTIKNPFQGDDGQAEALRFKIQDVDLPGRVVQTATNQFYGPVRNVAKGVNYLPVSMRIVCSSDFREQFFFYRWLDSIVGHHRINKNSGTGPASKEGYEVGYYDTYARDVDTTIKMFSRNKVNPTRVIKLIQSYPISVSPIALSASQNEVASFNVQMNFRHWIDENKRASASDPDELEVGLGETGDEFSGAKTVAERTQEGLDVIDKLIAQGKIEGKGRNTTNN